MKTISQNQSFGGTQTIYSHESKVCACDMRFSVFMPSVDVHGPGPYPVLYWLSGLTCTEDNFTVKAGAQRVAAELGMVIIAPDTSPRGENIPDDPDGAYDFGLGAGFYLDATQNPWAKNYQMYSYVTKELRALCEAKLPIDPARAGIFGHSMGGHGAITSHLKNPENYKTCSAFAPICAPSTTPWGQKAFSNYLGNDEENWAAYDATKLVAVRPSKAQILIDQGTADNFLEKELKSELFVAAAKSSGQDVILRMQEGYDHSFFFIATFIEDHLRWHHARLVK